MSQHSLGKKRKMFQFFTNEWPRHFLLEEFKIQTLGDYFAACMVSFGLGLAFEYISFLKARYPSLQASTRRRRLSRLGHLKTGVFRCLQAALAYINMLIAMYFNTGLFWALLLGFGFGSVLFAPGRAEKHHVH
jgi:hypothetical protein